jgi:hypothetical protein
MTGTQWQKDCESFSSNASIQKQKHFSREMKASHLSVKTKSSRQKTFLNINVKCVEISLILIPAQQFFSILFNT